MSATSQPRAAVFIGVGKMGGALLQGIKRSDARGARGKKKDDKKGAVFSSLTLCEPQWRELPAWLAGEPNVRLNPAPHDACDLVVLAVKPQDGAAALAPWRAHFTPRTIVVSLLAGTRLETLTKWCAPARVVRCMPNLPAALGEGALVACALDEEVRAPVGEVLARAGQVWWLASGEEDKLHAVTALSGSGPAYVYYLAELLGADWASSVFGRALEASLAKSGAALGLDATLAQDLAAQTLRGATAQLREKGEPKQLREAVTSPAGTTAAALEILTAAWPQQVQDAGAVEQFSATLAQAMRAAAARSRELAA